MSFKHMRWDQRTGQRAVMCTHNTHRVKPFVKFYPAQDPTLLGSLCNQFMLSQCLHQGLCNLAGKWKEQGLEGRSQAPCLLLPISQITKPAPTRTCRPALMQAMASLK